MAIFAYPSKSTDSNGWTVYDYGNFKEYIKQFGAYSTSSLASLGSATLASTQAYPTGIAPNTTFVTVWGASAALSNRYSLFITNFISASTSDTFNIQARNITSATISDSDIYVFVRMISK